jgi:hypothetical protein
VCGMRWCGRRRRRRVKKGEQDMLETSYNGVTL